MTSSSVERHLAMPLRDDNPSEVDLLGFEDVVDVLESIVTRADLDPITVGVTAPWGGGKTTVLQLLTRRLDQRSDVYCLMVSPWEYDNKTDPTTALIDEVLGGLETELTRDQSLGDLVKGALHKLRRRVKFAKALKVAATAALTTTLPGVAQLIDLFDDEKATDEVPPDPTLQGFRTQFAELMASEELQPLERVVVLVDDLDRSLPDTVVESLETIKLFLSVKKMAFVIAADEDNVASAIGRRLATTGQPTTSRMYLEKIVQVPVRVPALSKEHTEEYLALLMLADLPQVEVAVSRVTATRPSEIGRLVERLGDALPADRVGNVQLAERLTPLLHQHTVGNPRRLKRFLNAFWLRRSFAAARHIDLEPEALAKLMLAELHLPDLFGQLLSWLAAGVVVERVSEIEAGAGDYSENVRVWGQLPPDLSGEDLSKYLILAASLRGETLEEAALPPDLRETAALLAHSSDGRRREGREAVASLDTAQTVLLAQYLAATIRHQRTPSSQRAFADSISALAATPAPAATARDELRRMPLQMITPGVPLALLSRSQPAEILELVRHWSESTDASDLVRAACREALEGN